MERQSVAVTSAFLNQLQDADKTELCRIGTVRDFAKNDFIFKAGEEDYHVWILTQGRIKLFGGSVQGRELLLWFALAGEIFGLAECLQAQPRLIHARAVEPCKVLGITHVEFKAWLELRPHVSYCLMQIMALRMRELGQRFLSLASGNVQTEIAQLLLRLAASHGKPIGQNIHIAVPLTVQDLADMAGTSRQGASTCLAKMKRLGIVESVRHFMTIKNLDDLRQLAKGKSVPKHDSADVPRFAPRQGLKAQSREVADESSI